MEAITNLANTASKTIWGENDQKQGVEPVSGKQGDTSKGEPYDAGNIEPTDPATNTTSATTTAASNPTTTNPTATTHADTTSSTKTDGPNPAKVKDSSNMPGDSTKAQNDTRSPEEEGTVSAEDLKKPGPRPVAELAKEHGGDAGAVSHGTSKGSGMLDGSDVPAPKPEESTSSISSPDVAKTEGTSPEADKTHDQKKKEEDGTGEQYVKSSGLKADGGDFDATKPGAGREADRLLEVKGIHPVSGKQSHPSPGDTTHDHKPAAASPAATSPETKEKKSLSERIKAKLHHKSTS